MSKRDKNKDTATFCVASTYGKDAERSSEDNVSTTNWRLVWVAGIVGFLAGLEGTILGISEWAYMQQIDPEATTQFFGFATSLSKYGNAAFTVIFAFWCFRKHTIRTPLIAGRLIAFVACIIYLCVEMVPTGRRYLLALCYLLFGIAVSSATLLRTYIALVSTANDRARAYAVTTLANMLIIVVGPVGQLATSGIHYPGIKILPYIHFHLFTAPVWIATLTNFISVTVILLYLKEVTRNEQHISEKPVESSSSLRCSLARLKSVKDLPLPWLLVALVLFERCASSLTVDSLRTMGSPIMMTLFGWDGSKVVFVISIALLFVGLFSIAVSAIFAIGHLNKYISSWTSFAVALIISLMMYVLSYPWSFAGMPILPYDNSTRTGCNPKEYHWCSVLSSPRPEIYLAVTSAVMGIGVPLASISLDTIYSKLLGNIDQNMMQGLMVLAEHIVLIVGPIYSTTVFTYAGQGNLWLVNGVLTVFAVCCWFCYRKRFIQYA